MRRLAILLIVIALARMAATFTVFSATTDEPSHVGGGLEMLQHHRYVLQPMNPPLPRVIMAAAPHLAGVRIPATGTWEEQLHHVFYNQLPYERNLILARIGNLLFFAIGAWFVWLLGARELGDRGGLIALLLFTTQPIVLGYSALATHDASGMASFAVALFAFTSWQRNPSLRNAMLLGAAYGFAIVCKFSNIPYVPAACLALFLFRPAWRAVPKLVLTIAITTPLFIAIIYLGRVGVFIDGLNGLLELDRAGMNSYLFGEWSSRGWWWYFAVALLLKSTLPSLLLVLMSRRFAYLAAALAILLVASRSNLQLGVRYVLPVFVPLSIAMASAVLSMRRNVAIAIVALHVMISLAAHPDYFPYFNALAGRDPSRALVDSNIDWEQDALRLRAVTRELKIERLWAYGVTIHDYAKLGYPKVDLFWDPKPPRRGWIAIGEHFYRQSDWPWLRGRAYRRVGKSIRLFYVP